MMENSEKNCRYVCVYVFVCSRHANCPKQIKGLVLASLLTAPPLGIVVCEGVTLGGCGLWGWGVGSFGMGCVVSGAGVCGGVVFRDVGQKASITPPPPRRQPLPNAKKNLHQSWPAGWCIWCP